ncbi:Baseplate assembly protein J [Escherichia coli]|uniref:Baseplate assembly protein J n=1 Tax=Escherichia coli TaxID=562 RepID=A0AB38GSA2_ECOLX|nr:Baseplate assembly protein J [Escherichia coli]
MPAVDLSQLPEPAIIAEPDFEAILADTKAMMIASYPAEQREAVSAALELESEPLNVIAQTMSFVKCCYASGLTRAHAPAC